MGEFQAGFWMMGIAVYFFLMFTALLVVSEAYTASGTTLDMSYNAGSLYNSTITDDTNSTVSAADSISVSNFKSLISVFIGYGADDVNIGLPASIAFIFSFIFFWIPSFIGLWALYMALPFLH